VVRIEFSSESEERTVVLQASKLSIIVLSLGISTIAILTFYLRVRLLMPPHLLIQLVSDLFGSEPPVFTVIPLLSIDVLFALVSY